jgi:predicted amidohydrolase
MSALKIALVQMHCPKGRIAQNLAETARCIRQAEAEKANIICFPEMSITGYINPAGSPDAVVALDSNVVRQFCALTKGTQLTAVAGIVEHNPGGKPYITQLVASGGGLQGYYRKVNVADDEHARFAAADATPLFKYQDIPFGVAICADVGHADLFARYAGLGARLVLVAAAPGLYGSQRTRDWQSGFVWWLGECKRNLSKFAYAGNICVAVATQAGRTVDEDFPGGGYVFNSAGELIAATPDWSEGILYAQVDI